jgi:hypothetical protein
MKILNKNHVYSDGDYSIRHDKQNAKFSIKIFSGTKVGSNSRTSYRKMNILYYLKENNKIFNP